MKLEHYSNNPNLMSLGIDPKFYGKGITGAERKRIHDPEWINRSHFYLAGSDPEPRVGALPYIYTAEVPDDKIYDFSNDPLDLKSKSKWGSSLDLSKYESEIKNAGYLGFINRAEDPTMSSAVVVFYPVKPTSMRRTTRAESFLCRL